MGGETVFTVSGSTATVAQPIGLAEAGLTERAHLQEWVLANPRVLGADVRSSRPSSAAGPMQRAASSGTGSTCSAWIGTAVWSWSS